MALNPNAPEFKPRFPDEPPQVSKGLKTVWNLPKTEDRDTNPFKNIPNPYSTTSVAKGQGKKKRKTRKTKKTKRKTRKHRK